MPENFHISSLDADEASMRRACVEGTAAYANALLAAGYQLKAAPGLQDQEPLQ